MLRTEIEKEIIIIIIIMIIILYLSQQFTAMFVHATDNGMVIRKHCNCLLGPNTGLIVLSNGYFHPAIKP